MPAKKAKLTGVKAPRRRPVDGVVLLDKPEGMSSNQALQQVKSLFGAQKAGHTGSLDPLASGMLPVCFGRATRLSAFLLDANKRYVTRALLGHSTTTGDAEGEVLEELPVPELGPDFLAETLERFSGEIEQIPPMYSALKHQGTRLYQLARQGIEVARAPRRVIIHSIELLGRGERHIDLAVACSKGTYIRTLVEDICKELGTAGHVGQLRRIGVGELPPERMLNLQELRELAAEGLSALDSRVLPMDTIVGHLPAATLNEAGVRDIAHGRVTALGGFNHIGQLRLYDGDGEFVGIGEGQPGGRIAPLKVLCAQPDGNGTGAGAAKGPGTC